MNHNTVKVVGIGSIGLIVVTGLVAASVAEVAKHNNELGVASAHQQATAVQQTCLAENRKFTIDAHGVHCE